MAKLEYAIGDATNPQVDGEKIICHICNDKGRWGAGFVLALSKKWPEPEHNYLNMSSRCLGDATFTAVDNDITVVNMIAQHDTQFDNEGNAPVRYGALYKCLDKVARYARISNNASVHMPLIGCGLAGGYWPAVKSIITETLLDAGVDVYVYLWEPTVADFMMIEPKASIHTFLNGEFAGDPGSPEFYHIEPWKIDAIQHEEGIRWNLDVHKSSPLAE